MRLFMTAVLFTVTGNLFAQCFQKVFTGEDYFIAISQDGSLWGWGENGNNQLGDGSTTDRLQPVLISSGSWSSVSAGFTHTMAIKSDGTLWAWGSDSYDKLGNGSSGNAAFPQQIGMASDWKEVIAGERGTLAIKTNGTLWGWGANSNGYLGNGQASGYQIDVPVQIGTATNWNHIAGSNNRHCIAIKTDGTLWAWGRNHAGQIGDGTTTDRFTSVQIGTTNDWKWIDAGSRFSFALKNDNTLWAWGFANSGISLNSTTPLQIGTDTWKTVSVKKYESQQYLLMTKANGTLWGWGSDDYQQLGNGTGFVNFGSPAQIGTETNWVDAFAGFKQSSGVKTDGSFWAWGTTNLVGNSSTPVVLPTAYSCTALGVSQNQKETATLYPNPVANRLFVAGIEAVAYVVYDMNGRQYDLSFDLQDKSIDVSRLSAGIYILSIETEKGKVIERFIKK